MQAQPLPPNGYPPPPPKKTNPLLIAALVVVGIIVVLSIVRTVAMFVIPKRRAAERDVAKADTKAILYAAESWRLQHPGSDCPTLADLKADSSIKSDSNTQDPWGKPYRIVCDSADEFGVASDGPDGTAGNADDVWAGQRGGP